MWKEEKPNPWNLKLFGCKAYEKILGQLKKLDDRSRSFKFVGYVPQGYKLWNEEKRKITIYRDVRFEAEIEKKARITIHEWITQKKKMKKIIQNKK